MFILDEMHLAKDAFLQDIAILFNFHMDSTNPFVLILAGLPHLQAKTTVESTPSASPTNHHAIPDGAP
ncbi:hypothetical protein GA8_01915 [Geobacillus sp. A8]|nr:hypothetical protein GA8_01915 [Geobacillus sp. A8]